MLNVLGTIITPDTPLIFFASCALASAILAIESDSRWWIPFGLSLGLGLDSKYTMIVPGVAVALALLSCGRGRQEFRRPWVWMAALLALGVFSPVFWWNATHHWASFEFQLHHGTSARANVDSPLAHLADLAAFFGGQMMIYTPVFFVMGMMALIAGWRRVRGLNLTGRMLLFSASAPLALFAFFALRRRPEPNWPLVAYLPLTLLIVKYAFGDVVVNSTVRAPFWLRTGLITAICFTIALHLPEVLWTIAPNIRQKSFEQNFGWRELAGAVHAVDPSATVYCDTYENAAELSFYLPGRPQAWTLCVDRPTMFDDLPGRPDLASLDSLVFVSSGTRTDDSPPIACLDAFPHQSITAFEPRVCGHRIRQRVIVVARR
jgi:4-amino-4-deoxy-L-arabinose transferase-like glycosyltransferase